jgi:uncharacterized RDD family membrane protein YckC
MNPKIWYMAINGQQQGGPFAIDELLQRGLAKEALVWKEGMDSWVLAKEVSEIMEILQPSPPKPPPLPTIPPPLPTASASAPPPLPTATAPTALIYTQPISAQPVSSNFGKYELATPGKRFGAMFIKSFIATGVFVPLQIIILVSGLEEAIVVQLWHLTSGFGAIAALLFGGIFIKAAISAILFVVADVIVSFFSYIKYGGHIGHKILGLKVVCENSGCDVNDGFKGAFREMVKFVSNYFVVPSMFLLWNPKRQNLYDRLFGTLVVKNPVK